MFDLNRSAYYRNVLASDEPTAETTSNEAVIDFWKNLYSSEADTRDYSDVVQKVFTAANDEDEPEITLADVQTAVKCTRNWSASGRDTVYNFWLST